MLKMLRERSLYVVGLPYEDPLVGIGDSVDTGGNGRIAMDLRTYK